MSNFGESGNETTGMLHGVCHDMTTCVGLAKCIPLCK